MNHATPRHATPRHAIFLLLFLVIFSNANAKAADIVTGLVGHWKLDGNAKDYSGKGVDGTIYGATATTDRFGTANGAMGFDGSSNFINLQAPSILKFQKINNFSVAAWFKTSSATEQYIFSFFSHTVNAGCAPASHGYLFGIQSSGIVFITFDDGSSHSIFSALNYNNNLWHHVVGVWNGTNLNLYVDGASVATPVAGPTAAITYSSPLHANIGESNCYTGLTPGGQFNGSVDDVRVYKRALTQADVTALYNMGQARTMLNRAILRSGVIR